MTVLITVTAVLVLLVAGVVWLGCRLLREVARYEDWDHPPVKAKREHWQ